MSVTGPNTTGGRPRQQSIAHYSRQGKPASASPACSPAPKSTVDRHGRNCVAVCLALPLPHPPGPGETAKRGNSSGMRVLGQRKLVLCCGCAAAQQEPVSPRAPGEGAGRRGSSVDRDKRLRDCVGLDSPEAVAWPRDEKDSGATHAGHSAALRPGLCRSATSLKTASFHSSYTSRRGSAGDSC